MKKNIGFVMVFIIGWFLFLCSPLYGSNQDQLLKDARQAYDSSDYNKAIKYYQKLLDEGYDNAELYFNLGNAAFKANEIGEAIAFYRRAAKRAPWDDDIEYNLEFARQQVKQQKKQLGPIEIIKKVFLRFSAQQLSLIALIFYMLLMLISGFFILKRKHYGGWNWTAAGVGLIFIFFAVLASARLIIEKNVNWGVIVAAQAEARNGPGDDNQVGFTIPEGREVRILGMEDKWLAIGLIKEGYKGWVKKEAVWQD